jgi:hypothetical protein
MPLYAPQANVQAGAVPLADGGVKLAAALAQRRDLLRRKRDLAAGRVLSYQEAGSAAAQGPFTAGELEKLLRAGLLGEGTPVTHPQLGVMPLSEVREAAAAASANQRDSGSG